MSSANAIVLAGLELLVGEDAQPLTPEGALPPSAIVSLTRATLVSTVKLDNAAHFLVKANINEDQSIVLTSLSNSAPSTGLDLVFHADSTPTFSLESADGKPNDKVTVHLSGYVEVNEEDEDEFDEDELAEMMEGEDEDEDAIQPTAGQKRKASAALADEDEEDEENENDEEEEEAPTTKAQKTQPAQQPKKQKQQQQQQPAVQAKPQTVKRADGLQITDEVVGTGAEAKPNKSVSIRYKGELTNGKVFDSNMPRGQLFSFRLGAGECIPGFDAGIKGMKVGGRRVLVIPPQLGYGKKGSPPTIPPNATLKFTVELVKA